MTQQRCGPASLALPFYEHGDEEYVDGMHRTNQSLGRRLSSASLCYRALQGDVNAAARRWPPLAVGRGPLRWRRDAKNIAAIAGGSEAERMARVEAVLFLARQPLSSRKLSRLANLADGTEARTLVRRLKKRLNERGAAIQIEEVGGGFQLLTRAQFAPWLQRLHAASSEIRLSAPAMETLAVVAYRGTVLRAEIESIRGVQCGEILRQLMERDLVRIAGRSEELGRPYLYAPTKRFLQVFGLQSLESLPRAEQLAAGRESPEEPAQSVLENDSPDGQDIGTDARAASNPKEPAEMVTDMTHPTTDESTDVASGDPREVPVNVEAPVNEYEDEMVDEEQYEDEYEDVEDDEEEDDEYEYIYEDGAEGDEEDELEEDEEYEDGDEYEYVEVDDDEEAEGGEETDDEEEDDEYEYEYEYEEVDDADDELDEGDEEDEDLVDDELEDVEYEVDENGEWVEADDDEEEDDEYEYEYEEDEEE